jgi:prepilin-type N-terminal cleavage/methylation domain-containing protein
MNKYRTYQGFTLLEIVVSLAIFVIFALGIYGSIQLSFSLVYQSRIRIIGTALLNEQMEIVRNIAFEDVGIKNGSPSGIFDYVTTTNRNGMIFQVTKTIRNIDDPFDGVIGGEPEDTTPADYKFVQIDVRCISCGQVEDMSMYTYVAPKYLEGNPDHGALFVRVIDAYGNPVPEATVHIVATSTNPTYDFFDVTDTNGFVRVYDLATGTAKFFVSATKEGFTSDETRAPTESNPNPAIPFISVLPQSVSNLTLSIDDTSSLVVETLNLQCTPIAGVQGLLKGTRLIGSNPDIYLVNQLYTSSVTGTIAIGELPWDSYGIVPTGYDLIGTIPDVPFSVLPGSSQQASVILGPNTSRSLIVAAKYQGAPVASAEVTVTGPNGFEVVQTTGVGSIAQTTWSSGPGVENFGEGQGFSNATGIDPYSSPGNIMLTENSGSYTMSGFLESSTIEAGENARYIVWSWNPMEQSPSTTVRIQIATSSSTESVWNFVGPDGTADTFYTESSISISSVHDDDRYMRYRIYLDTIDPTITPIVSELGVVYTNACIPPGQMYLGGLSAGEYTIHIEADGFQTYEDQIEIGEDHFMIVDLTTL